MRVRNKKLSLLLMLGLTVFTCGCNLFEAVDSSINTKGSADYISEGNDKLAEANYATALDLFDRAMASGASDEARRGRASARAGLAGFNMFSTLNSLQNEVVAPNSSAAVFKAALHISDLDLLNSAIDDMAMLSSPTDDDLLFRALMAAMSAAKTILTKYDTNLNNILDTPDQINQTTNDKKIMPWAEIYARLSSASSPYSIEKAYIELTKAFDGRGTAWTTMSPFNSVSRTGLYTQANRNTISAVGNFGELLKVAHIKYSTSSVEFKNAIMALDGAN